ncbi:alcohol dehydrogenase catalytic domain-containing protein [Qiania dongpingensis]|uniref:Alcohol dehydrogenase catalytic domain-containing protein n=1 Tax=Qiania dongpingensis TaxID=2763669 RepID=A0A7G9G274_9FIRM|nr:alcohol dehydrogenase catalytic domain-containing protein [Qiania dongpingensis]QNM04906.1 alcohol dehydrogenase catalytic domain-containing protein [Qiania dongpingensis]
MNLPNTMKAVMAYGRNDYAFLEDAPVPQIENPDDIILKIDACGICGSDVMWYQGADSFWGNEKEKGPMEPPVIPGHEYTGTIVAMGAGAASKGYALGERVVADMIKFCGECFYCKRGEYNMCENQRNFGHQSDVNGAFAEYMRIPEGTVVYRLPADMPLDKAVLIEPFCCAMHGVERARITKEDLVVISGMGCIGLAMVSIARKYEPRMIVGLEMNPARMELAKKFGCDLVLNPKETDVVKRVKELTEGRGCDVYLEVAAHPSSVYQGLDMIRKKGRFVQFSALPEEITYDWTIIGDRKELDIYGSYTSCHCFEKVIQGLYDGSLKSEGMITHRYSLDRFFEAVEKAARKEPDVIKIVMTMDGKE